MGVFGMLWFAFGLGLALWVGGAVTGQVMMARAKARKDYRTVVVLTREVSWIIPRVYIPVGVLAIASGLALVVLTGTSFFAWWVVLPILVYLGIVVMGSAYSLPEYGRLNRMFAERGERDPEAHRRLTRAAWVNRIELAIVALALFGIVAGVLAA
jgi:hypothetical protein